MAASINLVELNKHLAENSYITGFQPSQNDNTVYDHLETQNLKELFHVQRWFNHIHSFGLERNKFPQAAENCPFFNINSLKGTNNEVTNFYRLALFCFYSGIILACSFCFIFDWLANFSS